MNSHVPLERQFSLVTAIEDETVSDEFLSDWGHTKRLAWDGMDREFRCVILAEAGAGKTEEFRHRASHLEDLGKPSFFIRIEDIEADFYKAFEIGGETQFQTWLQSTDEAWFFLDSVDEARLENPRKFEKALRYFAKCIKGADHRAHIYLSSRLYAWRPNEDRRFIDEILFLAVPKEDADDNKSPAAHPQSALTIYTMLPLDVERIRRFCLNRGAKEIDCLLSEIERTNLSSLAERPFDLDGILVKWADDNTLGSRLELLRYNINKRLSDDHNSDRAQREPLNLYRAQQGARRLAAAVILTGTPGLNVPDATPAKPGIEAEAVLTDWDPKHVRVLLDRGIFNDVIYGAVRFRHREVRDLLAAEWFRDLLASPNSRLSIESLLLREQYGENIITPRLRPVLPWLILFDDQIRQQAQAIHPDIAIEGGDPSQLPLTVRRQILRDIVQQIATDKDVRSAQDNSAIARIANTDLTQDTRQLISEYIDNDQAIFFLGRLVWQGAMDSCVAPFISIAVDSSRRKVTRIASARAVMTCGTEEQKQHLWLTLNESNSQIPREILTELVEEASPDDHSIQQLLISLGKLPPYERFKHTGLGRALHSLVERLPADDDLSAIDRLIQGMHDYLIRPPYVERGECHVSEEFAWLLSPATHAVETLVFAHSKLAFGQNALSIMLMVPALHFWRGGDYSEYKSKLNKLVPGWPELNDALYWASIEQARSDKATNSGKPLTDDWSLSWLGHFWAFDTESLPRLLDYMRSRTLPDDRMVALSTAFRVYVQANKPSHILTNLQDAVTDNPDIQSQLNLLLNPPVSEAVRRQEEQHAKYQQKRADEEARNQQARDSWITELRADPDRVRNPSNLSPGEWTADQNQLLTEVQGRGISTSRTEGANWRALIPDFGEAVARAYRDACVKHWRHYTPTLCSEGIQKDGVEYRLIFALAGLEIESSEETEFPANLDEAQARHALRYLTWEINGLPSWVERIHQTFPTLVEEAVLKELHWELENTEPNNPMHYILHDLVSYAPWLHAAIAPIILGWMETNPTTIGDNQYNRQDCIIILINGGTDPAKLAALAKQQIDKTNVPDSIPGWYALRVDCDPDNSIPELEQWLVSLDKAAATRAAQIFITVLMGSGRGVRSAPHVGHFKTGEHLQALYILMHRYIPVKEDIDRIGTGCYTPGLRDDAKDAREQLFNLLTKIPGKASYSVIRRLIRDHPDSNYRPWMAEQAYKRAEEDGDIEPWTAEQVSAFDKSQTITPVTHRQLFDLTVQRLQDLKNWLERGNDSPWKTWQRSKRETEMRTLIAGWLNQHCSHQYTTAQEPEIANSQRMDIWLQNTNVSSPVPIELKLLDKSWSGPKLCERLRNQLVGDYLREESARCGVMLLVWLGSKPEKRWRINGRLVGLGELASTLKGYWQSIADEFPSVESIDVVVIDLNARSQVCDL